MYPKITHVFFNGSKAETAFRRHVVPRLPKNRHVLARLPSTSPTPSRVPKSFEAKMQAWSVVRNVLS